MIPLVLCEVNERPVRSIPLFKIITPLFVFLKIFIKLIKLYFIHRQMMCHTFWKRVLENCVVSFKGHTTAAGSAYSLAIHSAFIYRVKIILPPCRKL